MKFTSNNIHTIAYILSLSSAMLVSQSSQAKTQVCQPTNALGVITAPQASNRQLNALRSAQTMCGTTGNTNNMIGSKSLASIISALKVNTATKPAKPVATKPTTQVATKPTTQVAATKPTTLAATTPVATMPATNMGFMPVVNLALIQAPIAGYSDMRIRVTTEQPPPSGSDNGGVRVWCQPSHMAKDDPIVFPGQQGRSHLHTFFGNTGANYASTSESIRTTGNSTCNGGIMNRSAYWVPSMIDTANGAPLKPRNILSYYKHGPVNEIPRGLKMIAGSMASQGPQEHEWFECNEKYASRKPYLVSCGQGGLLSNAVTFPNCWNGQDLDSADHKSHMAYSTNGVCAATHPKKLPTLTVITYYNVTSNAGTANWRLASDMYPTSLPAGYSSHADFMMGWDEAIHKTWVSKCINASKDCHAHLLGDGRMYY